MEKIDVMPVVGQDCGRIVQDNGLGKQAKMVEGECKIMGWGSSGGKEVRSIGVLRQQEA